ncbi:MAG: Crp/Fnr family transcriptional regulator [Kangiellaceae bacterium]
MISINEQTEVFNTANIKLHALTQSFVSALAEKNVDKQQLDTQAIQTSGFRPNHLYVIQSGSVAVEYDETDLFLYEENDLLIPHSMEEFDELELYYTVKSDVVIDAYDLNAIIDLMTSNKALISSWFAINNLVQLQMNQIVAKLTDKEERANPGFSHFKAGSKIISEGDEADYVYSVTSGKAVAMHNGVEVGEIKQDEIFGAIAVLTEQKRTATVIAKTNCSVLMVHKDEFSKMVHSHPHLFMNIINSLADNIKSLNDKLAEN